MNPTLCFVLSLFPSLSPSFSPSPSFHPSLSGSLVPQFMYSLKKAVAQKWDTIEQVSKNKSVEGRLLGCLLVPRPPRPRK